MSYSILIIDDSEEDRYLLKRYLRKSGLDVTIAEAGNGEEALAFLTNYEEYKEKFPGIEPPLVVFLDINMPIMNGWEFLEEFYVKQEEIELKPTVVVMYSTSEQDEEKARIAKFDCVRSYVVKGSYTPEGLKETILKTLSGI